MENLEMENIKPSPIIYTGAYHAHDIGDIICWSWAILDTSGEITVTDSGYLKDAGFGRHKVGANIVPIVKAFEWASSQSISNFVILSDSLRAVEQVNGLAEAPKGCNEAYADILLNAQVGIGEVGGQVAWTPAKIEAIQGKCLLLFVELFKIRMSSREKLEEFLSPQDQEDPSQADRPCLLNDLATRRKLSPLYLRGQGGHFRHATHETHDD